MRIAIGSDHAGFPLKQALASRLAPKHEILDMGTRSEDSVDYPLFAERVARSVADGEADRGILVCGTGIGMAIAANKVPGIRACVIHDAYSARAAVEHNDLNVLTLGGRVIGVELADAIVQEFLRARFSGGRHQRRLDMISALEATGRIPQ